MCRWKYQQATDRTGCRRIKQFTMTMKKCLFILLLLCTGLSLHARKWDSLYINKLLLQGETDKVLQYYLSEYPNGINASRIAELYVLSKDFPKAIQWFEDRKSTRLNSSHRL